MRLARMSSNRFIKPRSTSSNRLIRPPRNLWNRLIRRHRMSSDRLIRHPWTSSNLTKPTKTSTDLLGSHRIASSDLLGPLQNPHTSSDRIIKPARISQDRPKRFDKVRTGPMRFDEMVQWDTRCLMRQSEEIQGMSDEV